jgi:hypothetical protein
MSQTNSLNNKLVIPAKAGIQQKYITRLSSGDFAGGSGQHVVFVPLRGDFSINWIPAFAGMTELMGNQI